MSDGRLPPSKRLPGLLPCHRGAASAVVSLLHESLENQGITGFFRAGTALATSSVLASGDCSDDPSISEGHPVAGFDTFIGTGTGKLNGEEGATITFKFTDAGEPGKGADLCEFTIVPPGGGEPVVVSGYLQSGNQQAHGN